MAMPNSNTTAPMMAHSMPTSVCLLTDTLLAPRDLSARLVLEAAWAPLWREFLLGSPLAGACPRAGSEAKNHQGPRTGLCGVSPSLPLRARANVASFRSEGLTLSAMKRLQQKLKHMIGYEKD